MGAERFRNQFGVMGNSLRNNRKKNRQLLFSSTCREKCFSLSVSATSGTAPAAEWLCGDLRLTRPHPLPWAGRSPPAQAARRPPRLAPSASPSRPDSPQRHRPRSGGQRWPCTPGARRRCALSAIRDVSRRSPKRPPPLRVRPPRPLAGQREGCGQQVAAGGAHGRQGGAERQPDPRPEQRSGQNVL